MGRLLSSRWYRLAVLAFALAVLPGVAGRESAPDGALVDSELLSFDAKQLRKLERIEPATRRILADVEISAITYMSDGLRVRGYLAMPKSGEGFPCVIYNRGGNRAFGALNDAEAISTLGSLARSGYVVIASQYRGNGGGEGREEFGGADVADVLNLIPLLDAQPRADATRIGMIGWSRGGMMTYLALARTDRIAAAVIGAGAANLDDAAQRRPEMDTMFRELIPNYETDREAQLTARSALRWPERLSKDTPILLLHGSADSRVNPRQTLQLAEKLYELRHPFRLVFFENGDHSLSEYPSEVDSLITRWLDRYVRHHSPWQNLDVDATPHER
jgi:dipeptidyl aminopeptidase/acylaminoacyl peptidase